MRARSLLLACTALAVALLLTGCGNKATPGEVLAAAAVKTQDAKTSKVSITVDVSGQEAASQLHVTGEGAFDYPGRKGKLSLHIPLTGPGSPPTTVDSVMAGTVVYQHLPAELGANLPKGKSWIKLDVSQLSGTGGVPQAQSSDPTQAMQFLRGVSGDVTEVGKEKVRGEDTTHYKATLDLEKAAQAAGQNRDAVEEQIKQLGTKSIPADIWIDGDGRMRRMHYAIDVKGAQAAAVGGQAKVAVTLELFEFGTEVSAEPPPADQVADVSSLLGGAAG
jgi:hypothetical protein